MMLNQTPSIASGDRTERPERRPKVVLGALGLATLLALVLHISIGTQNSLSPFEVVKELVTWPHDSSNWQNSTVWDIRMPRALECLLVGGLLGSVGSVFQALLRNPLADPYTVGVSSGAALGGVAVLVTGFGGAFHNLGIAAGGSVTGVLTLILVYWISLRRGVIDVRTLLLAGILIGSLFSAILSLILLTTGHNQVDVLSWMLGDTSHGSMEQVYLQAVTLVCGFTVLYLQSRKLNAFAIGEQTARRLGVDVRKLTQIVLLCGGVMTAVAVGTVGVIGFLGLVAPHIARKLVGVDWRWSLPASLAVGALLLVTSDAIAGRLFSVITHTTGMDIPVGIVTSLLGAPILVLLLRKV